MANFKNGRGLDVGTGVLCESRMDDSGNMVSKSIRDSFLEISPTNKLVAATMRKGLVKSNISFFELNDKFYILGEDALIQSIERQSIIQRPMRKGVISPIETKALPLFKALLKELLGNPQVENEKVVFSIPGTPTDAQFDIHYHESVVEQILKDLGYVGRALNEGHALVFSELADEDYTGICLSLGSGMTNVAIANYADLIAKFSITKGGDFIDESTALALGYDPKDPKSSEVTPNLVTFIKEQGVDVLNPDPEDRIKIGIAAHYKVLIKYIVDTLIKELKSLKTEVRFTKPVPIVIAGGTSLAKNFIELFSLELNSRKDELPFQIKEIRHSKECMVSVSQGCLLALLSDE